MGVADVRASGGTVKGFVIALLTALALPSLASAHDVSYSYADLRWMPDRVELSLTIHRDDAAPALGIAAPESLMSAPFLARQTGRLADLVTTRFRVTASGHDLAFHIERIEARPARRGITLTLEAPITEASSLSVRSALFPDTRQHSTFLNVYDARGRVLAQELLTAERPTADVYAAGPEGTALVLATFLRAGIHHIFIGPDHILFLVGLLLLGGTLQRVIQVATSFTLAHSITLALAVLGVVRISGRIVEPMIALSIVYVGFENLRAREGSRDWRTRIAFAFGLIHGFGFAGVLRELGLPHVALAWSLLGFNLGVEVGQVCIVLAVVPLLAWLRAHRPHLAPRAVRASSWGIACMGGFWLVQRLLAGG